MAKNSLRQKMLSRRKQLDGGICQALSSRLQQRLIGASCFQQARALALYSPINNEVRTEELLTAALSAGKQVYYPKVVGSGLRFCRVNSAAELSPGAYGVAEPTAARETTVDQLDLIVVPGVAFDRSGYRLGYGKGFYDRELDRVPESSLKVGLCFEFQLCPAVPHEDHDRPVNLVITENQIIPCYENVAG